MSYEIRHKTKGFSKTFATKQEVKDFLDAKAGRAEAWEGHENLNLGALDTKAEFDAKFAAHAETTQKAVATQNKPVKRAAPAAKKPAVKPIPQKTVVRKPAAKKAAKGKK